MERGRMLLSLRITLIPLLTLFIFSLIWCLNISSSSRCTPICFWVGICWTVELLNRRGGWYTLSSMKKLQITSWACLDGSRSKDIFYLLPQRLTLSRSLFSFCEVLTGSKTTENNEVSSAKSFTLDSRLPDKSLIYIYIQKTMDQELNPEVHQLWLSLIYILVHSEKLFVIFQTKKIPSKVEDHPLHPNIWSYKYTLHVILNQKF